MLVFALCLCYCATMGENEGQDVLVVNLRVPGFISDTDPLYSSYTACFAGCVGVHGQCLYTDCRLTYGALMMP